VLESDDNEQVVSQQIKHLKCQENDDDQVVSQSSESTDARNEKYEDIFTKASYDQLMVKLTHFIDEKRISYSSLGLHLFESAQMLHHLRQIKNPENIAEQRRQNLMKLKQFLADPKAIATFLKTAKTHNRKQETYKSGPKKYIQYITVQFKTSFDFISQNEINMETLPNRNTANQIKTARQIAEEKH
jgi:hypothetical protein